MATPTTPTSAPSTLAQLPDGVAIVIAAYNEGTSISSVIDALHHRFANLCCVVVVDDGSADDTAAAAESKTPHVLRHVINRGQGASLQTGMEYALRRDASFVVTFDADGQHDPDDIPAMIAPLQSGDAKITLGSRFLGAALNMPRSRRFVLHLAVLFTRIANRVHVTDTHNGIRAFSREAAKSIQFSSDRMSHASQILDAIRQSGLPYAEVPVTIRYSDYSLAKGQSSMQAIRLALHSMLDKIFG